VWIHIITFVLCAATAACGGYRLHNEYNMNVAQTHSILVRRARARASCSRAARHAHHARPVLLLRALHPSSPECTLARRGLRALLCCAAACIVMLSPGIAMGGAHRAARHRVGCGPTRLQARRWA